MLAVGVNISPAIVPLTIVVGPPVVYDSSIILPVWRNVISSLALGAAVDDAVVPSLAVPVAVSVRNPVSALAVNVA
jgi:hypothetical protein